MVRAWVLPRTGFALHPVAQPSQDQIVAILFDPAENQLFYSTAEVSH
jgi:hypothetical protein